MNMKKEPEKTILEEYLEDPEFAKLMAQGDLIMEVTETLCELLEKEQVSRKELADRLGKSKGFVSQLLGGGRNLTLRTVADILHVLGYKVSLIPKKLREKSNIIEIQTSRNRYVMPKSPTYAWGELKSSFPDNYPKTKNSFAS
jgi:transcriptional regulator with XRE-family HTH domain